MRENQRVRRLRWFIGVVCLIAITGCTPAYQPSSEISNEPGKRVSASGTWTMILDAAQASEAQGRYKLKSTIDVSKSSIHSSMSIAGSLNPPTRGSFDIVEANNDVQYYQQGEVAYFKDNNRWSETTPLSNIDVLPGYIRIIQRAMDQNVVMEQLADEYVNDEYCSVYRATIPATFGETSILLGGRTNDDILHDVQFVFFVGNTDHLLRQVQTQSVSSLPGTGSMETKTNTQLWDYGSTLADVQLPSDLAQQLESP